MKKKNILGIFFVIISIIVVSVLGSVFVNLGMDWFNTLNKPSQWISNFVIPIVWTVVYIAFAVILTIWQNKEKLSNKTIILLVINGVLNVLWCLTFFTLKQLLIGNIVIVINAFFAVWLILEIAKYKKLYSYILCIYPIWVCIATTLNTALWILN